MVIVIEGGGSTRAEQARLREGFSALLGKVSAPGKRPAIRCAGGRDQAFKDFEHTLRDDPGCLLLVDSEGPVTASTRWEHVRLRDKWEKPTTATEDQLHFMVEAMESWLAADPESLASFYGAEFKPAKLPKQKNLEEAPKVDVLRALESATNDVKTKGTYTKSHGFQLIGLVDPSKVGARCPHAAMFFAQL